MRQSNRTKILEAAFALVQREGLTRLTLESVAVEAGLTKGGLMYHFPTREALLVALHEWLAEQWEGQLEAEAGKRAVDATATERLAAYARVSLESATRADLQLMLESVPHDEQTWPWADVLSRWSEPAENAERDDAALVRLVARLAADGLWMYQALGYGELSPGLRGRLTERITRLVEDAERG
ncbi:MULTISPECIES: TetR/AcrR family transcriptional regulator [Actinosynnema]|uniref:TetR/AcrR family transcriptional regulator n=1 Tax=Actinosynnema TaxID=40566 RepID=UPI0020A55F55|nr:TetR/AcrR family transcriptional regulator [Actinosynnema pretiosum]MCP2097183.1 transcriptional regulator, TetR family [Actinosynnema pretiosum]